MNITFFVGKPPKGLSIICGVSLGEGQRPTAVAILAITGDPQEPTFELAALKRYRTTTTINDIARDLAASLCLDRLRAGLPVFQAASFDGVKPSLIIDATLVGDDAVAEFERVQGAGSLDIDHFVALRMTAGATLADPVWRGEVRWFLKMPMIELQTAMRVHATGPKRFKILKSVNAANRNMGKRFAAEMSQFRGKTGGNDDILAETRTRPEDDLLLAAMSAVWLGSRPPDPPVIAAEIAPTHEELFGLSSGPRLDMTQHLSKGGEMKCHACGYQYREDMFGIWHCPLPDGCGAERWQARR
jgi:hypothetical protein